MFILIRAMLLHQVVELMVHEVVVKSRRMGISNIPDPTLDIREASDVIEVFSDIHVTWVTGRHLSKLISRENLHTFRLLHR